MRAMWGVLYAVTGFCVLSLASQAAPTHHHRAPIAKHRGVPPAIAKHHMIAAASAYAAEAGRQILRAGGSVRHARNRATCECPQSRANVHLTVLKAAA